MTNHLRHFGLGGWLALVVIAASAAWAWAWLGRQDQDAAATTMAAADQAASSNCVRRRERREVRGVSMTGLLDPGQSVDILHGYYDCALVQRGDWVVFAYSGNLGNDQYWLKTAQGLPGDRIGLGAETQAGRLLLVNDAPVLNPQGEPYRVDAVGASYIRLALAWQIREGVIPRGHYLMLGTAAIGGWDSRRVGLIAHAALLGKAARVE